MKTVNQNNQSKYQKNKNKSKNLKKTLLLLTLLWLPFLAWDCSCEDQVAPITVQERSDTASNVYTNYHEIDLGDAYVKVGDLANFKYYVLTTNEFTLTIQEGAATVSNHRGSSYYTNHYWTNAAVSTNDYVGTYSSNYHDVKHADIAGYTKLAELSDYRYYVLVTNNYTLVEDDTLAGYSNHHDATYQTNYYWTNAAVSTNDYVGSYASNYYDVKHADIAGYTKFREMSDYRYYVLVTNNYTLVEDDTLAGYSNYNGVYRTNHYWTNVIITNLNTTNFWTTNFTHGSDVITYILRYQRVKAISDSTIANDYAYIQPFSADSSVIDVNNTFYNSNGYIDFNSPEKVILFTNQLINGIYTSIGRYVEFYSNRKLKSLGVVPPSDGGSNAFYQGLQLSPLSEYENHAFEFNRENPEINFFNDGVSLRLGSLGVNSTLDGLTYSDHTKIQLFTNGTVAIGYLGLNATINGVQYSIDPYRIIFYWHSSAADRKVAIAVLENNTRIDGINFSSGNIYNGSSWHKHTGNIAFHRNGKVKQGRLNGTQTIRGTSYADGTHIRFNEDGSVHSHGNTWLGNFNSILDDSVQPNP